DPDQFDILASEIASERVTLRFSGTPHQSVDLRRARLGELSYTVRNAQASDSPSAAGDRGGQTPAARPAVDATGLTAQQVLLDFDTPAAGYVDMSRGHVGELTYVWGENSSQRNKPRLRLEGLVYERLNTPSRASNPALRTRDEVSRRIQ